MTTMRYIYPVVALCAGVEVLEYRETWFVALSAIPEPQRGEFAKWLYGQTMPLIPNVGPAAYLGDWERFASGDLTVYD